MRTLRTVCALVLGTLVLAAPARGEDSKDVEVRWHGHACFELVFPSGLVVLTDPFDPKKLGSYAFPDVKPDVVTVSHEHFDHGNADAVAGSPKVFRGLTSADRATQDWRAVDETIKGVRIRTVGVFHDEQNGEARGKVAVFVFEVEGGPRIVHLGDLGHVLTKEQVEKIGPVDALLVPVGGAFTIDAKGARAVCEQLAPKTAILPMHYRTAALDPKSKLAPVDGFLDGSPWTVERKDGNATKVGKGEGKPVVVVLTYPKKEGAMPEKGPSISKLDVRAWTNNMPGPGAHASFHLTGTVEVEGGPAGAKLTVIAKSGKSTVTLEDADGKSIASIEIGPNEKRSIGLAAPENASAHGEVTVVATLTPPAGAAVSKTVKAPVQDVR